MLDTTAKIIIATAAVSVAIGSHSILFAPSQAQAAKHVCNYATEYRNCPSSSKNDFSETARTVPGPAVSAPVVLSKYSYKVKVTGGKVKIVKSPVKPAKSGRIQ